MKLWSLALFIFLLSCGQFEPIKVNNADCISAKLEKIGYTDKIDCISSANENMCQDIKRYNAEVDAINECTDQNEAKLLKRPELLPSIAVIPLVQLTENQSGLTLPIENKSAQKKDPFSLRKFIDSAPKTYWVPGAAVSGTKRRSVVAIYDGERFAGYGLGSAYWDLSTKKIYFYAGKINDDWLNKYRSANKSNTTKTTRPVSSTREIIGKGNVFAYFEDSLWEITDLPKTPIDWLEEYSGIEPIKIDNSTTVVKIGGQRMTTDLKVTLPRKGGGTVRFTFDMHYRVPLLVEEFDDLGRIKLSKTVEYTIFDTRSQNVFNRVPLEEVVQLTQPHIIISEEEWNEWVKNDPEIR